MISGALDFNNRRSGRDKSSIGPPAREIGRGIRSRSPRAGVQSARVEPNLETAMYNDRGPGQRKFGGARSSGPGVPRNYECISDCIYLQCLALQFNGASICHLTP